MVQISSLHFFFPECASLKEQSYHIQIIPYCYSILLLLRPSLGFVELWIGEREAFKYLRLNGSNDSRIHCRQATWLFGELRVKVAGRFLSPL